MSKTKSPYDPKATLTEDKIVEQSERNTSHDDQEAVLIAWKRDLAVLHHHRNMSRLSPEVASYVDGKIHMLELCITQLRSCL